MPTGIMCQAQEFPLSCGDMAVLRQSMELLKFVSNIRRTSRYANFMDYKLHHGCWYDNPKTRWMSYILVDLIHDAQELYWRSSLDQCRALESNEKAQHTHQSSFPNCLAMHKLSNVQPWV